MTFKHIKFTDSEIMRSFEKVAHDTGMIKSDNNQNIKTDSVLDTVPTNNLNINILKLCKLLREKGLESKANELESNFLNYNFAESKDPGEKRIEDAHDKSPQFGDSEYGVIENILEEHRKILDVVRKQPTGKLASNKDILNAVKHILASNEDIDFEISLDKAILDKEPQMEVELGKAIVDSPKEFEVELGEAIVDPKKDYTVEFGEAIVDKKESLKKSAQVLTDANRKNSAYDTLKKTKHYLSSVDTSVRSIVNIDSDDAEKFSNVISGVINIINNINHSNISLQNVASVISSINSLKTQLATIRDSFSSWATRPIFSSEQHNTKFSPAFAFINKALLQAQTAHDVLNGFRDEDLKKILLQTNNINNEGEKELSKFKSKLEDWTAWFRLAKPYKEAQDNETAAAYIESQFLNPVNSFAEYFNRIKDKNPEQASQLVISKINEIKNSPEYLIVLNEWKPGQI